MSDKQNGKKMQFPYDNLLANWYAPGVRISDEPTPLDRPFSDPTARTAIGKVMREQKKSDIRAWIDIAERMALEMKQCEKEASTEKEAGYA